jgi:hypothetical protein
MQISKTYAFLYITRKEKTNMYLDPSFGGMLLQVVVALIAAGGVVVFALRRKIRRSSKKTATKPPHPSLRITTAEKSLT